VPSTAEVKSTHPGRRGGVDQEMGFASGSRLHSDQVSVGFQVSAVFRACGSPRHRERQHRDSHARCRGDLPSIHGSGIAPGTTARIGPEVPTVPHPAGKRWRCAGRTATHGPAAVSACAHWLLPRAPVFSRLFVNEHEPPQLVPSQVGQVNSDWEISRIFFESSVASIASRTGIGCLPQVLAFGGLRR
jgi:hypothetical protein